MVQAALITGDGRGLETRLYIRPQLGSDFENHEALAAPQTSKVGPSGMRPRGQHLSGSSQVLPGHS